VTPGWKAAKPDAKHRRRRDKAKKRDGGDCVVHKILERAFMLRAANVTRDHARRCNSQTERCYERCCRADEATTWQDKRKCNTEQGKHETCGDEAGIVHESSVRRASRTEFADEALEMAVLGS
jgi:hypothetical protein